MNRNWTDQPGTFTDDDDELFASFDDADLDEDAFGSTLELNEVRQPGRRGSGRSGGRQAGRLSSSRLLPHDWADFDYSGSDDAFDSNWR